MSRTSRDYVEQIAVDGKASTRAKLLIMRHKGSISAEEAKRRGEVLAAFREGMLSGSGKPCTQAIIASLSDGWLSREEVTNVEKGKTLWQSQKQSKGIQAALNLTEEQLEAFLASPQRMSAQDVFVRAWSRVKEALDQSEEQQSRERDAEGRARAALAKAEVAELEFAQALLPPLKFSILRDPALTEEQITEMAIAIHSAIVGGERKKIVKAGRLKPGGDREPESGQGSHKTVSTPPTRRR